MDKKAWSQATKEHALTGSLKRIHEGAKLFKEVFSREEQWEIIEDVISIRTPELCLAYSNVINVYCGYKVKDSNNKRGYSISKTPSVVFVVNRKLEGKDVKHQQQIPEYILTNTMIDGETKVLAIPTDVVSSAEHYDIELQSNISVESAISSNGTGTTTCGIRVRLNNNLDSYYYMSCRHVFSLSSKIHPKSNTGSSVRKLSDGKEIAKVSKIRGKFNPNSLETSLDSQLSIADSLSVAVRNIKLNGSYITSSTQIPNNFYIQTSRRPILVQLAGFVRRQKIKYSKAGLLTHRYMIKSYLQRYKTINGDSGSPLTSDRNGGTLIGMHLGITKHDRKYISMAIPAWLLFDSESYENTNQHDEWNLYL